MKQSVQIGNNRCSLTVNDITDVAADTMVVSVPQMYPGRGGVFEASCQAGAIRGCESLHDWHELSSDGMRLGEVMTVPAGGGKTKYLSHVASVCELANGRKINLAAVVLSVQSVLEDMVKRGLRSATIPLMGTGEMGWLSSEQSAYAILAAVDRFSKTHPDANLDIKLVVKNLEKARVVQEVMDNPMRYTDLPDEIIMNEPGNSVPPTAEIECHRANHSELSTFLDKYASATRYSGIHSAGIRDQRGRISNGNNGVGF